MSRNLDRLTPACDKSSWRAREVVSRKAELGSHSLPIVEELLDLEPGDFPLLHDPRDEVYARRPYVIGMTVLRPRDVAWRESPSDEELLRAVEHWTYSVDGTLGGGFIAAGNVFDAYRLSLQYAMSDAVLVGGATVAAEGVSSTNRSGHLWQPNYPLSWKHVDDFVVRCHPQLGEHIQQQREMLQAAGYLSPKRDRPAQVIVTAGGGAGREGAPDILDARIFRETYGTERQTPFEVFIVTSSEGGRSLQHRLKTNPPVADVKVIAHSPEGRPKAIDLLSAMRMLRTKHDGRVINHDGGAQCMSDFAEAGVLDQMNLTLCRNGSIRDLDRVQESVNGAHDFFSRDARGRFPGELQLCHAITDWTGDVVVATFDPRALTRQGFIAQGHAAARSATVARG